MFRELTLEETGYVAGGFEDQNTIDGGGGGTGGSAGSWTFGTNNDAAHWVLNDIDFDLSQYDRLTLTIGNSQGFSAGFYLDFRPGSWLENFTVTGAGCVFIWRW